MARGYPGGPAKVKKKHWTSRGNQGLAPVLHSCAAEDGTIVLMVAKSLVWSRLDEMAIVAKLTHRVAGRPLGIEEGGTQ